METRNRRVHFGLKNFQHRLEKMSENLRVDFLTNMQKMEASTEETSNPRGCEGITLAA